MVMDIMCDVEITSTLTVGFFFHLMFEHENERAIIYNNKYYIPKEEIIF